MNKKYVIKVDSQEQKENLKNTRKTLKVLQQTANDKENLTGRHAIDKEAKLAPLIHHEIKNKKIEVEDKAVQTGEAVITAEDLTSDEPSADYWKHLAEKREELLNDSLQENQHLKDVIGSLEEENKICKEMLEESRSLVEILQEMIQESEAETTTELAEEADE